MKEIEFLGTSKRELRKFPEQAKRVAGFELRRVQRGEEPEDTKPMATIGPGVQELRVWVSEGSFRVIYFARLSDAIYVLHVFQKKTQTTAQRDIDLARTRYSTLMKEGLQR